MCASRQTCPRWAACGAWCSSAKPALRSATCKPRRWAARCGSKAACARWPRTRPRAKRPCTSPPRGAPRPGGSTAYPRALPQRGGVPEWQLSSSLQGLALALPAPLGKPADSSLPLRFDTRVARESLTGLANAGAAPPLRELITLDLGTVGSASYLQDLSGPQARVLRGAIGIGLAPREAAPQPAQGVAAHMRFDQGRLDVDAWRAVLAQATEPSAHGATPGLAQAWLPTTLALRARALTLQGRTLHNLVARVQREGATWRANLHASELEGYLEYRPPGGATEYADGLVFARLARARMPPSEVAQAQSRVGTLP